MATDTSDFEKPEADVSEQLRTAKPTRGVRLSDDPEVDEADRLEQAQEVPLGDGE